MKLLSLRLTGMAMTHRPRQHRRNVTRIKPHDLFFVEHLYNVSNWIQSPWLGRWPYVVRGHGRNRSLTASPESALWYDAQLSWRPLMGATLELKRGSADKATQLLQPTRQYEAILSFRPTWVRGQVYLQAKNGALAAAEFQSIIESTRD